MYTVRPTLGSRTAKEQNRKEQRGIKCSGLKFRNTTPDRQPCQHFILQFLIISLDRCSSRCPTNSVKALKIKAQISKEQSTDKKLKRYTHTHV